VQQHRELPRADKRHRVAVVAVVAVVAEAVRIRVAATPAAAVAPPAAVDASSG